MIFDMEGRFFYTVRMLLLMIGIMSMAACVNTQTPEDPFQGYNRSMHGINDSLDKAILRPISVAYVSVAPDFVQQAIKNFYKNTRYPLVIINQLLQGKINPGVRDSGRFLVNSTLGILGFFDPAIQFGLIEHDEDFGQTLGVWGVSSGPYIVLPFWGPSTLRDAAGDSLHMSSTYIPSYIDDIPIRNAMMVLDVLDTRAVLLDSESMISGGDPYLFIRDAYLQRRAFLVADGKNETDPFLD